MTDDQLKELQQTMFHIFGHKVDIYHFEKIREVVVVRSGEILSAQTALKVFRY